MYSLHVLPLLSPIINENHIQKVYTPPELFIKSADLVMGLPRRCGKNYNEASLESLSEVSMTKTPFRKTLLTLVVFCLFCIGSLWCQSDQRFFDDAPRRSENVRLTILNPTKGNIQTLVELRKQNLISIQDLIVIGLFHEKQVEDREVARSYEEAAKFAEENGHDWIKFHRLKEGLDLKTLFRNNDLTEELIKIFSYSDGLILFGGDDIPPAVYGEKTSLLANIGTPYRSYLETAVVFHLLGGWQDEDFQSYCESYPEFPILGLCLGCQSLNVGSGGTLFQDIPSEIYGKKHVEDIIAMKRENWHENPYTKIFPKEFQSSNMHRIKLSENGKFIKDWGFEKEDKPFIYSSHHQAVRKLGKGIRAIATSLDGKVIEAIEHTTYPNALGVQFHPEARSLWDANKKSRLTPGDEEETSLLSILEKNPPSLAFHKKLWSWFTQKLKASHKHRMKERH
jgi:putative glutamine amidotransferase